MYIFVCVYMCIYIYIYASRCVTCPVANLSGPRPAFRSYNFHGRYINR